MVTSVAVSPSSIGHDAMSLGKQRTVGAWTVLTSGLLLLLAAQLHHWIAPHDSDGAAGEILPVVVSGALGWLVVFGAALIAPHRASDAARTSRRYALWFAIIGVPSIALFYWTPLPWCLGVAALLLIRRARALSAPVRSDTVTTVLSYLAIAGPLAVFVGVLVAAAH